MMIPVAKRTEEKDHEKYETHEYEKKKREGRARCPSEFAGEK
jgi:hypothetical protein